MKLIDLEDEKEVDTVSAMTGKWKKPTFDFDKTKTESEVVSDLTKGTNFAKLALTLKTFNFADNTTMHGLRYIFMRDISRIRRFLWILIVLAGMGYWYYLVSQTFKEYLEYPTITKIKTVFEKKSEFPAVTLCNLNTLLKSKLSETEQEIIAHVFALNPLPPNVSLSDYDDVDLKEFFRENGPSYSLDFCTHKSKPCNSSWFSYYLTDYGLCTTFNPGQDKDAKYQTVSGSPGGLYLPGFFSIDEWVQGPYYYEEGFRILIHPAGTVPLTLVSGGIPLVPGFISEITITRHESSYMSPPYGGCGAKKLKYFNQYSRDKCLLECRTEHTLSVCGCRMYYMPGDDRFCTMRQTQACQLTTLFPPNDTYLFDATKCGCPQDCSLTKFHYQIAQSKASHGMSELIKQVYNIDIREAVGIKVFYQDLEYLEDIEEPIYTTEKLLCDVGGAAGLFLGCSFITIMEFLDFMIDFGSFVIARGVLKRNKRKSKIEVLD